MKFTCHQCREASKHIENWTVHRFQTFDELRDHRREHHPLQYADGKMFELCEIKLSRQDYYWIARQIQDKAWLKICKNFLMG